MTETSMQLIHTDMGYAVTRCKKNIE